MAVFCPASPAIILFEREWLVSLFVMLGSGGWIPEEGRMTACLAYRTGDVLFVFDAGSGLARLGSEPFRKLLPSTDHPIHLFLSHLHLDHTVGLTYLPALWDNPTVIHIPPKSVLGVGPEALDALFGGPFFPLAVDEMHPPLQIETLPTGTAVIEGVRMVIRPQQHPGGSVGFRVADEFVLMTDARFDPAAAELARGVQLLLHEASAGTNGSSEHVRAALNGHSAASEAALLAREADPQELVLCHLPPFKGETYYDVMLQEARAVFPRTCLAFDGLSRTL
jgi:ribonuclease BN (tRNA processing enzyme)